MSELKKRDASWSHMTCCGRMFIQIITARYSNKNVSLRKMVKRNCKPSHLIHLKHPFPSCQIKGSCHFLDKLKIKVNNPINGAVDY